MGNVKGMRNGGYCCSPAPLARPRGRLFFPADHVNYLTTDSSGGTGRIWHDGRLHIIILKVYIIE